MVELALDGILYTQITSLFVKVWRFAVSFGNTAITRHLKCVTNVHKPSNFVFGLGTGTTDVTEARLSSHAIELFANIIALSLRYMFKLEK